MFVQTRKSLGHGFRFVSSLDRGRIGPAKHLRMQFFRELPAETREARDLVTLGYDNIHRQTHAENPLRLPEFVVETIRLVLELGATLVSQLSLSTDEIRTRDRKHETVERALRPVLLQEAQDRVPATVTRGPVVAQHKVARDVEHDSLVEEI